MTEELNNSKRFYYKLINFASEVSCMFFQICKFLFNLLMGCFCHEIFNSHGFPLLLLDLKSSFENFLEY